jgi:nucleoid-associated protein YgaU
MIVRIHWGRVVSILLLPLAGCAGPGARFVRTDCSESRGTDASRALAFASTIETRGLAGEQIVYRVNVLDKRGRPVRSRDGRYQDSAGHVAATRTFMVPQSPWTLDEARVSIPIEQLEAAVADTPLIAEFLVARPDGQRLAREAVLVPRSRVFASAAAPEEETGTAVRPGRKPTGSAAGPSDERRRTDAPRVAKGASQRPDTSRIATPERATGAAAPRATRAQPPSGRTPQPDPGAGGRRAQTQPARGAKEPPARASDSELWRELESFYLRLANPSAWIGSLTMPGLPPLAARGPATRPAAPGAATRPAQASTDVSEKYREYTVQKGDTLTRIAARELASAARWREIFELNRELLDEPEDLREGMKLRLPVDHK